MHNNTNSNEFSFLYEDTKALLEARKAEIRYWQDNIKRAIGKNSTDDFNHSKNQLVGIVGETFETLFNGAGSRYLKAAPEKFFLEILYKLDLFSAQQMLDEENAQLIYKPKPNDPLQIFDLKKLLEILLRENIGEFPQPQIKANLSRILQLILKVGVFSFVGVADSVGAVGMSTIIDKANLPKCTDPASDDAHLNFINWLALIIVFILNLFFYISINIPELQTLKNKSFTWKRLFKIILALLFDISAITLAYSNWENWGCYFDFGKLKNVIPIGITISILNGVKTGLEQISNLDKCRMAAWSLKVKVKTNRWKDNLLYLCLKLPLLMTASMILNIHMLMPLVNFNIFACDKTVVLINKIFGKSYNITPNFWGCFTSALVLATPAMVGSSDTLKKLQEAGSIAKQFGIKHSFKYAVKGLNKWTSIILIIIATVLSTEFGFFGFTNGKNFYTISELGSENTLGTLLFSIFCCICIGFITFISKGSETKANINYVLKTLSPLSSKSFSDEAMLSLLRNPDR